MGWLLQKSWKKLWPKMSQESDQIETQPADDAEFVQFFQQLESCTEVEENDISEWINNDSDIGHQVLNEDEIVAMSTSNAESGHQVLNEDEIVAMSTSNAESNNSEDEDDTEEPVGLTHSEATIMLDELISTSRNS
ncbi:hypothetical protein QE152_g4879 [Popillia japonica]|uniref:Uncharacterized protein n=1 Tax=Popillia japonica TaxID=7064 RepID=A0AAW1MZA3_POPJA